MHIQSGLPQRPPELSDSLSYATVFRPSQCFFLYNGSELGDSLPYATSDSIFPVPSHIFGLYYNDFELTPRFPRMLRQSMAKGSYSYLTVTNDDGVFFSHFIARHIDTMISNGGKKSNKRPLCPLQFLRFTNVSVNNQFGKLDLYSKLFGRFGKYYKKVTIW